MEQKKTSIMFYEICRLCLEERGHCDIFERDGLPEDIHSCTGVKVSLSDNLPQRICKSCLRIVNKATQLRIIAKRNEHHLLALFSDEDTDRTEEQGTKEPVSSTISDKQKSSPEKSSVIDKFLTVRTDLFESSVPEESILQNKAVDSLPDSSQKPEIIKRLNRDDGNTEYKCNVCSKKFDKWKKLYLHNRLHNKNYACPLDACGKKFSTKGDVDKHIRTHTGEKPYQCDVCEKSFTQRGTLKVHKETKHSVS
ncbi:zinc finger protein 624 isoform X2 [Bicyclus anynana]|uniref:Zinc finger protein 624 isoform X2 n=1 Tax=Bicyclus anynana TaxID=110368 RepID=A0A6J1MZ31_BICAN|nr:zinc finger protein 624 isoform X2 [Bicyclus anynana]